MSELTSTGYNRTRLDEKIANVQAKLRLIYGDGVSLDDDTTDGQQVGIFLEGIDDIDQKAEQVYNMFKPSACSGAALKGAVKINGITWEDGSYSTVTLTFTGVDGALVKAGTLVQCSSTGALFSTDEAVTIDGTTIDVTATATVIGALLAPADSCTLIKTPQYQITAVTNADDAIPGRYPETDPELRIRREKSVAIASQSLTDSLYAAVANIPGVSQCVVLENKEDVPDVNSLPPHSVFVCAQGGDNTTIAEMIRIQTSMGATLIGDVSVTVLDLQGHPNTIKFSRPELTEIYITVTLTELAGWPTDGVDRIKEALVAYGASSLKIGDDVIQSRLYNPINDIPGFSISSVKLGFSPSPSAEDDLTISFDELAVIVADNIVVDAS